MATMSTLLRAVRKASLASRAAAAAASRAAAMASRSARAAGVAAAANLGSGVLCPLKSCPARGGDVSTTTRPPGPFPSIADYPHLPDHAKTPTDKDMESDEAVWALYERWCKVFKKQRDPAEMARRFKIFKFYAEYVHDWNTYVPEDPEEAAIHLQKRREAKLLLSKGEDVSHFDEWHVPYQLGRLSDGGDPFLRECDYNLLKLIEASEACSAVKDVIIE